MKLSAEQQTEIRERYGVCVNEACDKCGQVLGWVRFTFKDESGEWCSRECRDGVEAHAPGTCKGCGARLPEGKRRGALYCDDACKQNAHRSGPQIVFQAIASTKRLIAYWSQEPNRMTYPPQGYPDPSELSNSPLVGALDHARKISSTLAERILQAQDALRNAKNEMDKGYKSQLGQHIQVARGRSADYLEQADALLDGAQSLLGQELSA